MAQPRFADQIPGCDWQPKTSRVHSKVLSRALTGFNRFEYPDATTRVATRQLSGRRRRGIGRIRAYPGVS